MIYGVFSGEYSDWAVVGYFNTEAEAEVYCKRRNESCTYDDFYVLPMVDLSAEPYEGERIPYWVELEKGEANQYYGYSSEDAPEDGILITENIFGDTVAIVWAYPAEAEKVVKIARDRYAEYKARKEGIV